MSNDLLFIAGASPDLWISGGQIIVEDGELRTPIDGKTLHVNPEYDTTIVSELKDFFTRYYSVQFANYRAGDECVELAEEVECRSGQA